MQYAAAMIDSQVFDAHCSNLTDIVIKCPESSPSIAIRRDAISNVPQLQQVYAF